eukprot:TRINITY_DN2102_c0_g2_i1.p2 TRINITY_DN2102_c0_g2~~TRINITY_DN2102_c0_g2_i1.p2  ORF type:complete len:146 (+),score=27.06 TRINITY_DN2102_c0_g2_i1:563-1000(+)
MSAKVRNHNMEKIFLEKRTDDSQILPTRVFQDQLEGMNMTIVEFANMLDMARYLRRGIRIVEQDYELVQLGMAAQRIQDLKMQEENMNKQITIRKSNNTRNLIRTEPEELISKELNNRVTENSKEIGELWTAVATLTQAQSDHWQ